MFVGKSMKKKIITAGEEDSVLYAYELLQTNNIRHLPIIDENHHLVGIVTDRDIRSAMPSRTIRMSEIDKEQLEAMKIREIMTSDVISLTVHDTIEDALILIQQKKVGALPVVDDHNVLSGIISVRDLLRAFINVLGINEPGTLLCILVEDKIGQMKKIVDAITEEKISFGSILVARHWDEGKRMVFPYLLTNNVSKVKRKLESMGYQLLHPIDWYIDQVPENK